MKKIFLITFMIITSSIYSLDYAVFPTRFNIDIKKMNTNEIEVINNTIEPLRLQVFVEADEDFGKDYNLNKKIRIFPKVLFIRPAGRQIVKFRVLPLNKSGEYKSYIRFKQLENLDRNKNLSRNTGITTNIHMLASLAIPIYGLGNNIKISGKVEDVNVNINKNICQIKAKVLSTGNASLKLFYKIKDNKNNILYFGKLGNSVRTGTSIISNSFNINKKDFNKNLWLIINTDDKNDNKIYWQHMIRI